MTGEAQYLHDSEQQFNKSAPSDEDIYDTLREIINQAQGHFPEMNIDGREILDRCRKMHNGATDGYWQSNYRVLRLEGMTNTAVNFIMETHLASNPDMTRERFLKIGGDVASFVKKRLIRTLNGMMA